MAKPMTEMTDEEFVKATAEKNNQPPATHKPTLKELRDRSMQPGLVGEEAIRLRIQINKLGFY